MKYIWLVLFLTGIHFSAFGQNISYSSTDKDLSTILSDISNEYNVFFSYSASSLPITPVTISVENVLLSDFLNRILRPFSLSFEIVEENFIAIKSATEIGVHLNIRVVDSQTGIPVELALVHQKGSYKGTSTNLDGDFSFFATEPERSTLEVSHIGYKNKEFSTLDLYRSNITTIYLDPVTTELEGIIVTEYLNTGIIVNNDGSTLSLRPESMDVLPGLSEPDALYSLQALPGVTSTDESASEISIRGSSTDQVSLYWDDIPIYHSGHYFGLVSALIPSSIKGVNVYRSSIPTRFGGAASGLLEMKGPEFKPTKPSGHISSNLTHSDASVFIPVKNQALKISARRSINDYFETATYNSFQEKLFESSDFNSSGESLDDLETESQNLLFWDINAKWIWQPSFNDNFSISFFSNKNTLDYRTLNEETDIAGFQLHEVSSLGTNASWDRYWSNSFETKLNISHSYYDLSYNFLRQRGVTSTELNTDLDNDNDDDEEEDPDDEEDEDPFDGGFEEAVDSLSDSGIWTNQLRNSELRFTNHASLEFGTFIFGAQMNILDVNYSLIEKSLFENDFLEKTKSSGLGYSMFGNYIWGQNRPLTVNSGVRLSNFAFVEVFTVDPQVNVVFTPINWLKLKASLGRYHQYIRTLKDFENSISSRTEEIWFMADKEDFPLLRNDQISGGFVFQKNGWLLDVEAYSKKLTGLISVNYNFGGLENEESTGEDIIHGYDVLLRKRIGGYRTWISYSRINANSFFNDLEDSEYPSFLDQKHKLQLVNTLSAGNFDFSIGWTFKTGAPYTEPRSEELLRIVEEDDNEIETEEYFVIDWGETNSKRLPNYHRLDVSVWYTLPKNITKKVNGEIGLSVLNVYNRANVLNRLYYPEDIDSDEEIEIVEDERYLLGITPNLSIKFSF